MLLVSFRASVITWLCNRAMRFQSRSKKLTHSHHRIAVAQWLEHPTRTRRVVGSNPIWGSEFLLVFISLYLLFHLKYTEKYLFQVFATACSAALHRRHLMVWKIFAPRFVFEGASFLFSIPMLVLVYLFFLRVNNSLTKWTQNLETNFQENQLHGWPLVRASMCIVSPSYLLSYLIAVFSNKKIILWLWWYFKSLQNRTFKEDHMCCCQRVLWFHSRWCPSFQEFFF